MKRFLNSIVDLRKGEIAVTLLMLFNLYLLMVTYYFLKPARDSLFLSKLGSEQLPYVFILTAFVIVPITTIYSRASGKFRLDRLSSLTTILIIGCLFGLRLLMSLPYDWIPYAFYIWVSIYGVLTTSQFWLLANAIYDSSQAKRIFSILGLAAIIGAWTGGEVTSFLISEFGVSTENLLYICAAILAVTVLLTNATWLMKRRELELQTAAKKPRHKEKRESFGNLFSTVKSSRHLLLIVGIISLTMLVASLVDFQFKTVATESYPEKSELTAFFGTFYGRLSLVSLLLQALLANRLLRWLGVGGSIMLLPIGLLLGSVSLFIFGGIIPAIMLRGSDGALKYSIDKTARELLYLPVSLEVKKRTKMFVDMFVDRWARGVGGALLLLLLYLMDFDSGAMQAVQTMSLVVIGLLLAWLLLTFAMRREYVNTFRQAIEKREIDISELRTHINDEASVNALIAALGSDSERQVVYALEMLKSVKNVELQWPVLPLLEHKSAEVRRLALEILQRHGDQTLRAEVEPLLQDDELEVRREALRFLCLHSESGLAAAVRTYLTHPENRIQYAALALVADTENVELHSLVDKELVEGLVRGEHESSVEGRVQLAQALGNMPTSEMVSFLEHLLEDNEPAVVKAAIASVGRLKDRRRVPWLIEKLGDRRYRSAAQEALAAYGGIIVGTLADYFRDKSLPLAVRKSLPRVMGRIPEQHAVDVLTGCLELDAPDLKYHVVKALNRMRARYPHLRFASDELQSFLVLETKSYFELIQVAVQLRAKEADDAMLLLQRAVVEKQAQSLERVFRLLGMIYSQRDIYNAYLGISSSDNRRRANAAEFLDNVLSGDLKRYLNPILDDPSEANLIYRGQELFEIRLGSRQEALRSLLEGRDSWLRACALFAVRPEDGKEIFELVKSSTASGDDLARETAGLTLARIIV